MAHEVRAAARTEPMPDYELPRYDGEIEGHDPAWASRGSAVRSRIRPHRYGCRSGATRSGASWRNSRQWVPNWM